MNISQTEHITTKVETFGCRLNAYESQVVLEHLEAAGQRNIIVFNTCAVTAESERQARQAIRRARRETPDAQIIVTGCAAQISPEIWSAMPEVDRVIGNLEKMEASTWSQSALAKESLIVSDIMQAKETAKHLISGFGGKARAFVEIQQGCDHRCTFCIIPYGRGNSRSAPIGVISRQVQALVEAGVAEIAFTGVDITSFGGDLPGKPSLGQLARRVLTQVPDLKRLRLSSIDPAEVDDDLLNLIAEEPRLAGHLHLSLQAGSNLILKRMKRRHLIEDAKKLVDCVRKVRPEIVFGADLIAGFPTETDQLFEETLNHVHELNLTWLHVFPYSPRPGTPAARMPQVPRGVIKNRAAILRELGNSQSTKYLQSQVGKKFKPIMETPYRGRAESFAEIEIEEAQKIGEMPMVHITGIKDGRLLGTVENSV